MTKLGRVGVGVIVLGAIPFIVMELWDLSQQHAWYPLSTPISLRKGEIRSPAFTLKPSMGYEVAISFDHGVNIDRMDCLLHIELEKEECRSIPEADDIRWTALAGGQSVAAGSSRDRFRAKYAGVQPIAKVIGDFDATRRAPYQIILEVRQDLSELDKANPHLEVLAFENVWDSAAFLTELSFLAVFPFSALGIFLILLSRGLQRKTIRLGLTP